MRVGSQRFLPAALALAALIAVLVGGELASAVPSAPVAAPGPLAVLTHLPRTPTRPPAARVVPQHGARPALSRNIIGGTEANPSAWPYLAFVETQVGDCTGERVAAMWILTAEHCVYDSTTNTIVAPSSVVVGVGDLALSTRTDWQLARAVVANPSYNPATAHADVALIELSVPAGAASVNIPNVSQEPALPVKARIAGWGLTVDGKPSSAPDVARAAETPLLPASQCSNLWGTLFDPTTELCAGGRNSGAVTTSTCNGDSGGPLVWTDARGNDEVLGTTDFGSASGCTMLPTVFQRVASYHDWILSTTGLAAAGINSVRPSSVTEHSARIRAVINTHGADSLLELSFDNGGVRYVQDAWKVPGSTTPQTVVLTARGLVPGAEYIDTLTASDFYGSSSRAVVYDTLDTHAPTGSIGPSRGRRGHTLSIHFVVADNSPWVGYALTVWWNRRRLHSWSHQITQPQRQTVTIHWRAPDGRRFSPRARVTASDVAGHHTTHCAPIYVR